MKRAYADGFMRGVLEELRRQGWRVEKTRRRCHIRAYSPDGKTIVHTGGTPGDHRALANWLADLRRAGFVYRGGAAA